MMMTYCHTQFACKQWLINMYLNKHNSEGDFWGMFCPTFISWPMMMVSEGYELDREVWNKCPESEKNKNKKKKTRSGFVLPPLLTTVCSNAALQPIYTHKATVRSDHPVTPSSSPAAVRPPPVLWESKCSEAAVTV